MSSICPLVPTLELLSVNFIDNNTPSALFPITELVENESSHNRLKLEESKMAETFGSI